MGIRRQKRAFITGITGQDGSYLTELLLEKGYAVFGMVRRTSGDNLSRIAHLTADRDLELVDGDMLDGASLCRCIKEVGPDEVYNLAAQSDVGLSFGTPELTTDINTGGFIRLLEAVRQSRFPKTTRIYQAGTSEMFGPNGDQANEDTPFRPQSPYAVSKVAAHWVGVNYRESYGMYVCNGILFNHESPRRGENFVTRKVTRYIGRLAVNGDQSDRLMLGNLHAKRDWGHAKDYVRAMYGMLNADKPDDFVIATGVTTTVGDMVRLAFNHAGYDWESWVTVSEANMRPNDVAHLCGDATKALRKLNWGPTLFMIDTICEMVDHDIANARGVMT